MDRRVVDIKGNSGVVFGQKLQKKHSLSLTVMLAQREHRKLSHYNIPVGKPEQPIPCPGAAEYSDNLATTAIQ